MCHRLHFFKSLCISVPKIVIIAANSVDPDEMLHVAASYLGYSVKTFITDFLPSKDLQGV